ncbi:glucosamine-6-phosphate deaminase [Dyadobacter frigoris]|uniref:Glucosamine-6-phosphate deaminase n=1 Tax=Dyadobacter frigoris TaxID=2576211 RepID=A0A4U6DCH9_9BACT|nr:glucosamine-6-phosphate deaminase [Dyadobacter frigoris]TKT94201.1 glucosamine-6-phosphate deaminase [Dyadobacter frigoris]GLU50609.1 glucosamine-6-phosphate isomerase [Dyadobacter frigoris]
MKLSIYSDKDAMSRATADLIADQIRRKPDSLLCFPSGESPTIVLNSLVKYGLEGHVDFSQCRFVGLDEWIGMDENDAGSCKHYLYSNFFNPLKISQKQIIFFDGLAENPDQECKRIDQYIQEYGPIDLMLVGLGMNGHIGLNEPGVDFHSYAHITELDPVTVKVAQKYFTKTTELSGGITLGLQHFSEAKTAVLIVAGKKKAEIVLKVLTEKISNKIPGTIIRSHENAFVFLDEEAASQLSDNTRETVSNH